MLRWHSASLAAALSLLLALVPSSKRITVTLDQAPAEISVGVPFKVGFTVHVVEGELPPTALAPLLVAENPASRDQVKVLARPDSAPGHYAATLILPAAGAWNWQIYPEGDMAEPPAVMSPLQVSDPAAGRLDPGLLAAGVGLLALAVALVTAGVRLLRRET